MYNQNNMILTPSFCCYCKYIFKEFTQLLTGGIVAVYLILISLNLLPDFPNTYKIYIGFILIIYAVFVSGYRVWRKQWWRSIICESNLREMKKTKSKSKK